MSAQLPVNDDSTAVMSVHAAAGCEKHPKKNFYRHGVPQIKELLDCVPYYFSCIVSSVTFFHNLDFFFWFFLSKRSNRKSQRSTKKVANNPFMMVIFKKPQEQSCNHTNFVWTCYYTVIVLKLFSAWEKLDGYGFLSIAAKHALQHVASWMLPSLMSEREAQTGWGTSG